METNNSEAEIKSWLKIALAKEKLQDFSVSISGTSEKGAGFIGDIVFVKITAVNTENENKEYNLVLKCSKPIKNSPVLQEVCKREIYMYEKVFPAFKKFQLDRKIEDPFDSIPEFRGAFSDESRQVIVLQNLKQTGYDLWDCKKTLSRKHIEFVLKQYAKFHATSVAMEEQEPEEFQNLIGGMADNLFKRVFETSDFTSVFEKNVEELYHMLKDDFEEEVLQKWLRFKDVVRFVVNDMVPTSDELRTITHGDSWSNNFMYKYADGNQSVPSHVAILDWQIAKYYTPITDLSYFLFACSSEREISNLDSILKMYYDSFSSNVTKLGSTFIRNYSFEKFLIEWKKYSKYGVLLCIIPIKVSYTDKEDKPDMAEGAAKGDDISKGFEYNIKNKTDFINRIKPIVKYAVECELFY